MVRVKMCGIMSHEDAQKALYYGASAVGFIFYKKSPRYISPSRARKIIEALPPFITTVGVFVNSGERAVREICKVTRVQVLQFHGDESTAFCKRFKDYKIIKAFRVQEDFQPMNVNKYKVDAYLFDAYQEKLFGGTGKTFNWDIIKREKFERPVILSGGLNAENIKEAIEAVSPFAVDVSSSIEKSPGVKDPKLIRAFMEQLKP